jgi:hypothetical protein
MQWVVTGDRFGLHQLRCKCGLLSPHAETKADVLKKFAEVATAPVLRYTLQVILAHFKHVISDAEREYLMPKIEVALRKAGGEE